MTVSNQLPLTIVLGNGTKGPYWFSFDLLELEKTKFVVHIIEEDKVARLMVFGVDYDIQINSSGTGGSITLTSETPASNVKIRMERVLEIEQAVIFDNNKNIIPKNIEQVADACTKIDQQQQVLLDEITGAFFSLEIDLNDAVRSAKEEADRAEKEANLSQDWAVKMDGLVEGVDYSSKHWANQALIEAVQASDEAAKASLEASKSQDWAVKMDGLVEGVDYSSKHWANQSKTGAAGSEEWASQSSVSASISQDWAVKMDGLVEGVDYSAKYWAAQAGSVVRRDDIPLPLYGKQGWGLVVNDQKNAYIFSRLLGYDRYQALTFKATNDPVIGAMNSNIITFQQIESGNYSAYSGLQLTNKETIFNNQQLQDVSAVQLGFCEFMPFYMSRTGESVSANVIYFGQFNNLYGASNTQITDPNAFYKFVPYYDITALSINWSLFHYNAGSTPPITLRLRYYAADKTTLLFDSGVVTGVQVSTSVQVFSISASGLPFEANIVYYFKIDLKLTALPSSPSYFVTSNQTLRITCTLSPYQSNTIPDFNYGAPLKREFYSTELYKPGNLDTPDKTVLDNFSPINLFVESITMPTYNGSSYSGTKLPRGRGIVTFITSSGSDEFAVQLYPANEYSGTVRVDRLFNGLSGIYYQFFGFGDYDRSGNKFSTYSVCDVAGFSEKPVKLFEINFVGYSDSIIPLEFKTKPYRIPARVAKIFFRVVVGSAFEPDIDFIVRGSSGEVLELSDTYKFRTDIQTIIEYQFLNATDNRAFTIEFKQLSSVKIVLQYISMMLFDSIYATLRPNIPLHKID